MTDTVELKPCPFCGSKANEVIKTQVKCSNDLCPLYYFVMHDTIWNTRPDSSLQLERVKELEERLAEKIKDRLMKFAKQAAQEIFDHVGCSEDCTGECHGNSGNLVLTLAKQHIYDVVE